MLRIPKVFVFTALALLVSGALLAQELKPITLPAPQTKGGKPLMQALSLRTTSRDFATAELPLQTLSNLLWAASGMNGPKGADAMSGATPVAPSAVDWQEIDIYVVMKTGAYVYDAASNTLKPDVRGDFRALTGMQPFVKDAPVSFVYVADAAKAVVPQDWPQAMKDATEEAKEGLKWADAMAISENVYLVAASEGLATGIRALVDRPPLAAALKLRDNQSIIMAQCVGFPKK